MKVSFVDFWGGFDPKNNFLTHVLKEIYDGFQVTTPNDCDYLIYSLFGEENKQNFNCKKVFFTGENVRPNFENCDYSFTFDYDDYKNRNVRIPLWYFYIDWFSVGTYTNPEWLIPVNYLYETNPFSSNEKSKFCSTVFSSPYDTRFQIVEHLKNYKIVDCYGKIHEKQIPHANNCGGEMEKMRVISNYKFSICFENSVFPGYFTEKLIHAKVAGNIPIYYSDSSFENDFNSGCCLNLINYVSIDSLIEDIKKIDSNYKLYETILKEPLFKTKQTLDPLKNSIYQILK